MIRFYDIPCKHYGVSWSPNTLKIVYTLNYMNLPYEVIWIELPDIEETLKSIGVSPTATKPDGLPKYTLPAIHDLDTGVRLSESIDIVEYLEATYPNVSGKALVPRGTKSLQLAFVDAIILLLTPTLGLVLLQEEKILNARSREYLVKTLIGKEVSEIAPPPEEREAAWKSLENAWAKVDSWIQKEDSFVMGNTACFVDFVLAGFFVWYKVMWGEDSEEWKRISSWQGGRWARLVHDLAEFERLK
ncbi:hypothetical protein VNI00_017380 [Paramarasmius palmivorus]|uniref:GST N-terminal domain-containing protein n=1 Tax=Paramarasmius palmivorus TaxID=297713 RepID=A0AAW0B657_9AGAR